MLEEWDTSTWRLNPPAPGVERLIELIDKHLKMLGRRGNLPAGIIISGGASGQGSISDIAKGTLNLPSRIADLKVTADTKVKDATWAVAYGLALWGLTGDTETPKKKGGIAMGEFMTTAQKFLKQFLP